jgi:hypothetical protein
VCVLLVALACAACTPGLLFTDVTKPLVVNMDSTLMNGGRGAADTKHIEIPVSGIRISAEWDSRAIGDAAKKAGLKTVHFADLRTLSVLGGLWEQQTIQVWGE